MFLGVTNAIGSILQYNHHLNTSNKIVKLCESTKDTICSLNTQIKQKWLILLAQKAVFQSTCSTCHLYWMQGGSLQCSARYQMIFSCQMEKIHNSARLSTLGLLTG